MNESYTDRSIDYFVVRATDAFISESERARYRRDLVAAVEAQLEAPEASFRLLAHRLLSPEQNEAMHTLTALEELALHGGLKVERELGRFKFMNAFIRLLSSKYQGTQTSSEVRARAVELLFDWRESMRAQTKIRDVYDLLRAEGIIAADPTRSRRAASNATRSCGNSSRTSSASRIAAFEDAEKARVLAELLRSKRPDDLNAANRLIKGIVKAEDKRIARFHKRSEVMNAASSRAELLLSMLENVRNERAILDADEATLTSSQDFSTMEELNDALLAYRPMLFRYVSEATTTDVDEEDGADEENEEGSGGSLARLLALNDRVNYAIGLFQERYLAQTSADLIGKPNDSPTHSSHATLLSESTNIPVGDVDIFSTRHQFDKSPKSASNRNLTEFTDTILNIDLRSDDTAPGSSQNAMRSSDEFLLRDVNISPQQLEILSSVQPIVFLQGSPLNGSLYPATLKHSLDSSPTLQNLSCALITLSSASAASVEEIRLRMTPANTLVTSRLIEPSEKNDSLVGVRPGRPLDVISYILLVLPLTSYCQETIVEFELRYRIVGSTSAVNRGNFVFPLATKL